MIVLNKKRVLIVTMCFVLPFFLAGIKNKSKTIQTVALPVENKVIILDAGHGYPDEGDSLLKLNSTS